MEVIAENVFDDLDADTEVLITSVCLLYTELS